MKVGPSSGPNQPSCQGRSTLPAPPSCQGKRIASAALLPKEAHCQSHLLAKGSAGASASVGTRAVGAVFVSPAFQRGVSETNNLSGVPSGRGPCSASLEEFCEKKITTQTGSDFRKLQTFTATPVVIARSKTRSPNPLSARTQLRTQKTDGALGKVRVRHPMIRSQSAESYACVPRCTPCI